MPQDLNPAVSVALDASARSYDANGRLHISKTHITKATVNPYFGMEIPNSAALGLDPQRIYYMLRSPEELAKAAPTFERIQILIKHKPILNTDPPKMITVGTTGSDISFESPYLDADVCLWDETAIAGIETKTLHEWSCAYHYVAVMTAGIFEGQRYDGIMTDIQADHLAIVEDGRAGSDVIAADQEIKIMPKPTKLGTALIATLGGMSAKLALDSALPTLVGQAVKKTFNKADVSAKLIAMDADLKPAAITAVFDSLLALDEEKKEVAEDADEHPKDCDCKECKKVAQDAADEEEEKKKKIAEDAEEKAEKKLEGAMDSFRKDLRAANEARIAVRPVVGDVIAQDSAEEIYGFALDHLKVDRAGVTGVPALKSLFTLAQSRSSAPVAIAQDSAGAAARFPNASRFRQG
jgi:hypothetical protein